jgi:hypothetical protein
MSIYPISLILSRDRAWRGLVSKDRPSIRRFDFAQRLLRMSGKFALEEALA